MPAIGRTACQISLASLVCLVTSAVATAGDAPAAAPPGDVPPADSRSIFDILGGATWSERRLEVSAGLVSLHVDGADEQQHAGYVSGAVSAVSGYRASPTQPAGGILGLGVALKGWYGDDHVDIHAIAPFVLGVAGGYAQLSERTRLEALLRMGPGFARTSLDGTTKTNIAWTWALETAVTVVQGEHAGWGIGLGYESVRLEDVEQDGLYLALRFGF